MPERLSRFHQGVHALVHWLSFIPRVRGGPLPSSKWIIDSHNILQPADPVEREITFVPSRTPYNPRWMLAGVCVCVRH
jgi:acetyl-CoA carboxylase / biotin carboxylase 1